jgi:quinol monooxygenase YgiN
MIPEIIRYKIPAESSPGFVEAYRKSEPILQASENCLGYDLIQSDKDPELYLLTIYWDSPEGHIHGFRASPLFPQFVSLIRPFIPMIQEMEHYHSAGLSWKRSTKQIQP